MILVDDDVHDIDHYEFYQMLYFTSFLIGPSKSSEQQQQQEYIKKESSPLFVYQTWWYVLMNFSLGSLSTLPSTSFFLVPLQGNS